MEIVISLKIMALGMLGIFVFMLFFWLVIALLQRVFPVCEKSEK